jgi:glutathione S-transferase
MVGRFSRIRPVFSHSIETAVSSSRYKNREQELDEAIRFLETHLSASYFLHVQHGKHFTHVPIRIFVDEGHHGGPDFQAPRPRTQAWFGTLCGQALPDEP